MRIKTKIISALALLFLSGSMFAQTVLIEGALKRWHKVTVRLTGPNASESNGTNPFLNYRYNVTFSHPATGTKYVVPGYFAADGNAGNSGATSGNKWKAHLSPDHTGTWSYTISFRQGNNVAVGGANAGSALSPYNGISGSFNIGESDKSGRDFRAKTNGRLTYVNKRYLKYSGSNRYFLKQGPDAPENFLNYKDFDGMFANSRLKTWSAHTNDWKAGDPTWKNGKGKAIIGSINYLASEGMNAFSFLTMNIGGDDNNAYPYVVTNNQTGNHPNTSKTVYTNTLKTVMDCSKLDQWEVVFEHATTKGMYLHFKTQETENDHYLDGGKLGTERKLYYRELIARFSHHLALNWNLGEENTNASSDVKAYTQFFYDNDPYKHNVVLHTYPNQYDQRYEPLLGSASKLTGLSIQTGNASFGQEHGVVLDWVNRSQNSGKPWVVAVDEPGDAGKALRPDNDAGNSHEDGRKKALWGTFMAGGAGNEWYFGYQHAHSDLTCEDFRSRNKWWDYCRHALNFFNGNNVPFVSMSNQNGLIGNGSNNNDNGYCFAKPGSHYVIYLPNGGSKNLNLNGVSGSYSVKWYDPRNGGGLQNGNVTTINGGGNRSIGGAPNNTGKDWVVYVVNKSLEGATEENDGYVVLEAEDAEMTGKWVRRTAADVKGTGGFTSSGYIRYTGNTEATGPANDVLTYKIKINNPGKYKLILRGLEAPLETGEGDKANDCYVRMVGQPGNFGSFKKHVLLGNSFQWSFNIKAEFATHTFTQPIYDLSAGVHEFQIAGRSKNFHIDRIVLYKDLTDNEAKDLSLENEDGGVVNPPPPEVGNTLNATSDFANITAGTVPYYKDNTNNALAIDASNVNFRNKFARAETTFNGESATYSVKIITLTEEDGESTYRFLVNGTVVKTYKNPHIGAGSSKDMGANTHTWTGVALKNGDKIAVESNTHTNGEIAEGSGTAWSRGRWRSIEFIKSGTPDPDPDPDPTPDTQLAIIDDAYLEKSSRKNDANLKVEAGNRVSYLKIDVKDADRIESASLKLTVKGDPGQGTIRLFAGSHSNWTEANLSTSNAPAKGIQLASANKTYAEGSTHTFDITKLITGNGAKTIIIDMAAGGNDVWFSSTEGSATPVVNVTLKPEAPKAEVTKLNLINATTDKVVKTLTNGTVINKATLPSFSVQAITAGTIGSVVFELNGAKEQTENQAVYSVSGNNGADYLDWPLSTGSYTLKATAFSGSNGSGTKGTSVSVNFTVVLNSLPSGKTSSDVGNTGAKTLATHNNGTYLISASGSDIWGKADSFGFVHQNASGDVEVTAKIESIEQTHVWAKAGVMIRESLAAGSKHAMTVITPAEGASFQRRTATNANSAHTTLKGIKAPEFVRVLRTGNKFTGYFSSDKQVWFPMNSVNFSMNADVKVGLAVTSHDNSKETEAMISNFTVRNPGGNFAVTRFFLVNADTNADIREIHHNETINLATDGKNLNVRAETTGIEGSVVFELDGVKLTENVAPYAMQGDVSGDYKVWAPTAGTYSIMATPYAEPKGVGAAGDSLAIIVNVVNN